MLKQSIAVGLLCLSGHALANINVTITEDIVRDDDECSIREAVTYVNRYLTAQDGESETKKTAREEIKNAGYNGCGGENATAAILLKADETYTLDEEINISTSVTIQTENTVFNTDSTEMGLENATIKPSGTHRLFTVDDNKAEVSQITVRINQVNLQGCGAEAICEDQGGIIFNRENLTLQYVKLFDGYANKGGAIYSAGILAGTNQNTANIVTINNSLIQHNVAEQGAVLHSENPLFSIRNNVIRENKATDSGASIIYSAVAFDDKTTSTGNGIVRLSSLGNTTLYNNTGYLLNIRDGVYVNNVTAIENSKGFYFNAPKNQAHISNSIVVNKNNDCDNRTATEPQTFNNIVGASCALSGSETNPNTKITTLANSKLLAGNSVEGSCDRPPADGLLCPFSTPKNFFLGYFKPRLLSAYASLSDSPIVNRGRVYSDGTEQGTFSCEGQDQRGIARSAEYCDIGAIELVINSETIERIFDDLTFGEVYTTSILDSLADGELLPANECAAVLGADTDPDGNPWQVGCLRIDQSSATPVSKGTWTLAEDGTLTYTPNSNWHGSDELNLRVVTTGTRFSDAESDRDLLIPVKISQNPENNFESKTVNVSGGAIGYSLFGLLMLSLLRVASRKNKLNKEC